MVSSTPGDVRLEKKLAKHCCRPFRPAASVGIARGSMTESGKLDPRDLGQNLLQCVKAGFQVCGTLAASEQQHLGADAFEALDCPFHPGPQLYAVAQRRRLQP